jgi:hypothetical protein
MSSESTLNDELFMNIGAPHVDSVEEWSHSALIQCEQDEQSQRRHTQPSLAPLTGQDKENG